MVPAHLVPILAGEADRAIGAALSSGVPALGMGPPTREPAFVAAFVLGAVPDIAARWHPHLIPLGVQIRVTGVFVHGAPKVSFSGRSGKRQSCELADLLLVLDEETNGTLVDRQAVLVQAKMAPGGSTTLTRPGDLVQYDLLRAWPLFRFTSKSYRHHDRDFSNCTHAGATVDCGRYGLIDNQPTAPQWHQHAPALCFSTSAATLGAFMADMAGPRYPASGRPALGTADDWSDTVEELLRVARTTTFFLRSALPGRHPRRNDALAMVKVFGQDVNFTTIGSSLPPPLDPAEQPEGADGISVVHVTLEHEGTP